MDSLAVSLNLGSAFGGKNQAIPCAPRAAGFYSVNTLLIEQFIGISQLDRRIHAAAKDMNDSCLL